MGETAAAEGVGLGGERNTAVNDRLAIDAILDQDGLLQLVRIETAYAGASALEDGIFEVEVGWDQADHRSSTTICGEALSRIVAFEFGLGDGLGLIRRRQDDRDGMFEGEFAQALEPRVVKLRTGALGAR
jgi:hypothetical protein